MTVSYLQFQMTEDTTLKDYSFVLNILDLLYSDGCDDGEMLYYDKDGSVEMYNLADHDMPNILRIIISVAGTWPKTVKICGAELLPEYPGRPTFGGASKVDTVALWRWMREVSGADKEVERWISR